MFTSQNMISSVRNKLSGYINNYNISSVRNKVSPRIKSKSLLQIGHHGWGTSGVHWYCLENIFDFIR